MAWVAALLVLATVSPVAAERDERSARNHKGLLSPDLNAPARAVPKAPAPAVPNADARKALAAESPAPAVLEKPFSAFEHDANMTQSAGGHLVTGETCASSDLKAGSEWAGAGGNAFVIRLKSDKVCGGKSKKGEVLKGFFSADDQTYASGKLAALPSLSDSCDVLAGLACKASDVNSCLVESKCVNNNNFAHKTENDDCWYVRMKNGGSKTLEQCLEEPTLEAKKVKFLVTKAVSALQCIHKAKFVHKDFQLKNLMVDGNCNSGTLKVVDLDGMTKKDDAASEEYSAGFYAFRDYEALLGACPDYPYPQLEDMVKNPAAKETAKKLREAAAAAMDCSAPEPWKKDWAAMIHKDTGPGAKVKAAAANL